VHPTKLLHRVQDDAQDAEVMDLNSTPSFFVNGVRHKGPWDAASLIARWKRRGPSSQRDVDLGSKSRDADARATQHGLGAPRRRDEPDKFGDGGLAGSRGERECAPFARHLQPCPLT